MTGEIHGIINRQQASSMWRANEDVALGLQGELVADNMTTYEATSVLFGASRDDRARVAKLLSPPTKLWQRKDKRPDYLKLADAIANDNVSPELEDCLLASNNAQQAFALEQREEVAQREPGYLRLFGETLFKLCDEGLLTSVHTEIMESRLWSSDGSPFMPMVAMTQLEAARLVARVDGLSSFSDEIAPVTNEQTDFNLGIIWSGLSLIRKDQRSPIPDNRVHEEFHVIQGAELQDITREDGWRRPEATMSGLLSCPPSTELTAGNDFSQAEDVEVTEGFTEFLAREAMRLTPRLGTPTTIDNPVSRWADQISRMRQRFPQLFRAVCDVAIMDATSGIPNLKRQALDELRVYADKQSGIVDALRAPFHTVGGTLAEYHASINE